MEEIGNKKRVYTKKKMKQHSRQIASATLLLILLVSCATFESSPSTIPDAATATRIPPAPTPELPAATVAPPTATTVPPTARPTSEPSDKGHIEIGQITSQALDNNLVGDPATRDFLIYLPQSYDASEKHYPVVYALHGYPLGIWSLSGMTKDLDEMVASGEVEEMIFIFVDGGNRFGGSMYRSSPTIGDYESYIVRELVDHIDANYRTLPHRDSRGITGCSMGGDGTLHLALKYPDMFSVAAPISGLYDIEYDPFWDQVRQHFWSTPEDFDDFDRLNYKAKALIAEAAGAASNPDKPPFYLDMPFEEIDNEVQIVQDVRDRIGAAWPASDIPNYLNQPLRLRGLMIYHGEFDGNTVQDIREFSQKLTELGIEHEYVEVPKGHCNLDFAPVLKFMSDHLVFGQ